MSKHARPRGLPVDGVERPTADGWTFPARNPATAEPLWDVPDAGLTDARDAVTAAFHHVSAPLLNDLSVPELALDVLVLGEGEDREATDTVQALADLIPGLRGIYAGRLRNAGQVEAFTANIIAINRRYKTHAGLRITAM